MGCKTFREIEIGDTLDANMEIEIEIETSYGKDSGTYINREDACNIVGHLIEVFDMKHITNN